MYQLKVSYTGKEMNAYERGYLHVVSKFLGGIMQIQVVLVR